MIHGKIEPFLYLKILTISGLNCVKDGSDTICQSIKAKLAFLDILAAEVYVQTNICC